MQSTKNNTRNSFPSPIISLLVTTAVWISPLSMRVKHLNDNIYLLGEEKGNGNLLRYNLLGVKNLRGEKTATESPLSQNLLERKKKHDTNKTFRRRIQSYFSSSFISLVQFRTQFKLRISISTERKIKSAPVWITSCIISSSICVLNTFLEFYTYISRDIIYKRTECIFRYFSFKIHFVLHARNLNCNKNTAVAETTEFIFHSAFYNISVICSAKLDRLFVTKNE